MGFGRKRSSNSMDMSKTSLPLKKRFFGFVRKKSKGQAIDAEYVTSSKKDARTCGRFDGMESRRKAKAEARRASGKTILLKTNDDGSGKEQRADSRLPSTRFSLDKKNDHDNNISMYECEGDQGFGVRDVLGSHVRSSHENAKHVEQLVEMEQTGVNSLPPVLVEDASSTVGTATSKGALNRCEAESTADSTIKDMSTLSTAFPPSNTQTAHAVLSSVDDTELAAAVALTTLIVPNCNVRAANHASVESTAFNVATPFSDAATTFRRSSINKSTTSLREASTETKKKEQAQLGRGPSLTVPPSSTLESRSSGALGGESPKRKRCRLTRTSESKMSDTPLLSVANNAKPHCHADDSLALVNEGMTSTTTKGSSVGKTSNVPTKSEAANGSKTTCDAVTTMRRPSLSVNESSTKSLTDTPTVVKTNEQAELQRHPSLTVPPSSTSERISGAPFGQGPAPKKRKRRRVRCISESKMSDSPHVMRKSIKTDFPANKTLGGTTLDGGMNDENNNNNNNNDADVIWMSDDVVGMVETKDMSPASTTPPAGSVDPWAYLWEPDAPEFEIELVSCAHRRNVKAVVAAMQHSKN